MNLTHEYKQQVLTALQDARKLFDGKDNAFARQWGLNPAVYSQLKDGKTDGMVNENKWLEIGRVLGINPNARSWNVAETEVFKTIKEEIEFCKAYSKSMMFVDDCEIGKTFTAKYLSKTLKHCFYIDCSQAKTKQLLVRTIAKAVGVDNAGKYADVKANLKYYLQMLDKPVILLDEAGDLEHIALLEIKELWNATDGYCGWYMLGADGLRNKIDRGINHKKVGYREIFSRFSGKYSSVVPTDRNERMQFYRDLITDVLNANVSDKDLIPSLVSKCLKNDGRGEIGGLRRAESLLILNNAA